MMRPGRPRTPIPLRIAQGNPAHRPIPEVAEFPTGALCPAWLGADAKKEWKRVAGYLEGQGLLTAVDQAMLAGYCDAYGTVAQMRRVIRKYGHTIVSEKGFEAKRPEVGILQMALVHMKAFAVEFGFSPASLARVRPLPKEKESDPMEALLSGS